MRHLINLHLNKLMSIEYTKQVKLPHTELVIGRSGSGKTKYLTNQLESILNYNPEIVNIFVSVEQTKVMKILVNI